MLKNLLIGLILATSLTSRAQDAISIQKGQPAPYSGVLFSEDRANSIRKQLVDKDILSVQLSAAEERHILSEQIIKLKDFEIELFRKQNQRLVKASETTEAMKIIYFGLGILATGAAVYGAGALSR